MYYSTYLRWYDPGNESMTHTICSQTRNLAKEQSKWSGIRSNQNEAMCLQSTYSHVAQYHWYLILKRGCLLRISATSVKIKRSIRCTWLSSHTHEISMFCIVHPIKGARNKIYKQPIIGRLSSSLIEQSVKRICSGKSDGTCMVIHCRPTMHSPKDY